MRTKRLVFALVVTIIIANYSIGQNVQKEPKYYNWFDDQVNRYNTSLFNGIEYVELYRTINDRHKFFESSEFLTGSIVYDGQFYDEVALKYDLNVDELLFNVGYNYTYPTLILFKSKIAGFQLGESDFIQITNTDGKAEMSGFYELIIHKNPLTLFKKNRKKRFKRIKGQTVYYEFEYENSYYIKFENDYYEISSKNDVVKIWPDKKNYINEYFNSALRKTNEDYFWKSFFEKLADTLNSKEK